MPDDSLVDLIQNWAALKKLVAFGAQEPHTRKTLHIESQ